MCTICGMVWEHSLLVIVKLNKSIICLRRLGDVSIPLFCSKSCAKTCLLSVLYSDVCATLGWAVQLLLLLIVLYVIYFVWKCLVSSYKILVLTHFSCFFFFVLFFLLGSYVAYWSLTRKIVTSICVGWARCFEKGLRL